MLRIVGQVDQAVGVVSNIKVLPLGPFVDGEVKDRYDFLFLCIRNLCSILAEREG